MNDQALHRLAAIPSLKVIRLWKNVTEKELLPLTAISGLIQLDVSGGTRALSDKTATRFLSKCTRLQSVAFKLCCELTDKAFLCAAGRLGNLRSIILDNCFLITDRTVVCIAQECHHLEMLRYVCVNVCECVCVCVCIVLFCLCVCVVLVLLLFLFVCFVLFFA
jgi:hypothetical protein